jgi:dihydrofolate synthase / folylpolyglutamate synthase
LFDPDQYLRSLEPIGWRFGLERIRRLTSVLGMPQHRFASIHIVGTNGKSSVVEMAAALIEAHGVSTGAYLSPHSERWSERVRIRGVEIGEAEFADAVERTAEAAPAVNRTLEQGEAVTQFEAATAAALVALAAAGVQVGVIEAGLGGRLDATNVIPSRVAALTSVGLEHTQWLGSTEAEIAAEKLAVLRDHSTLVLGRVSQEVEELAERVAGEHGARLVEVSEPGPELRLRAAGPYQRRNFAVARAVAEALLGELDTERVRAVAEELQLPGRMEVIEDDPSLILDAAHNPDGARALAEALGEAAGGRPVVGCLAVLADKDVRGFVDALAPALDEVVCTELPSDRLAGVGRPDARSAPASELAEICRAAGIGAVSAEPDPSNAVRRALRAARERHWVTLCAGSHYLLGYAWIERRAPSS